MAAITLLTKKRNGQSNTYMPPKTKYTSPSSVTKHYCSGMDPALQSKYCSGIQCSGMDQCSAIHCSGMDQAKLYKVTKCYKVTKRYCSGMDQCSGMDPALQSTTVVGWIIVVRWIRQSGHG